MPLNKVPVDINFVQGLNTKTDPFQIPIGQFLSLVNTTFNKLGQLTKRNGFEQLTQLPINQTVTAATFNGNLVAIGNSFQALSEDTGRWFNKGLFQPLQLSVVPQVRTNSSQLTVDASVASNGLSCNAWYDSDTNSYYRICNSVSGEVIVNATLISATTQSATVGPKVFALGSYFIVVYWETISTVATLRYIAIPINNPAQPGSPVSISAGHSITSAFDGAVAQGGNLYLAFYGASTTLKVLYITPQLVASSIKTTTSVTVTNVSVCTDNSAGNSVYVTWYDSGAATIDLNVYDINLNSIVVSQNLVSSTGTINGLGVVAQNNIGTIFYENNNDYGYTPNSPHTAAGKSDYVSTITFNIITDVVGTPTTILRSVGLASKPFYISATDTIYVLLAYGGLMQPTFFLSDVNGNIVCKLAYSNGGGYPSSTNLPQANVYGNTASIGYLFKDLTTAVNKDTALPANSQVAGIYSQIGINLASFTFTQGAVDTAELGGSLQLTGGFMWQYDGVKPVEQGFHLYPEDIGTTTTTGSGDLTAQTYFYVATYEWTDAIGNIHRSAPSVPVSQVTTTSSSTNTIKIPTLRLTYKVSPNPVRIVIYRWSTAQQIYYQVTSITSPITNDPTSDSITYSDAAADSAILGNTIIYTNGGVVEDIAAPAVISITPFNTRLFAIDAEDRNLLWFSKQVIENTPVEMSDLFTLYVAPTISATGSTGPMKCLSALDDKLIIFKKDAIYYINGAGPDNTGANNGFSDPIFITSTVGCDNQQSIVFMPNGLMFQSDKGIWLLGRDLSTTYIGAPVAQFNNNRVLSANNIPGTNQVRFRLDNGITLMYDYFYNQWGTFEGINGVSSTIYQDLETVVTAPFTITPPNQQSYVIPPQLYQETPGVYLDGTNPVLMSFVTGWINAAGLQGYERFYQALLLGNYLSPFSLNVQFAYNYNSQFVQSTIVKPDAPQLAYGLNPGVYGSGTYGGPGTAFKARVFPVEQKCESFQVSVNEQYDPSFGVVSGAGLTLSGMQLLIGVKKGSRTSSASRSFG